MHPPPISSNQLHPPPPSSFQPPLSSLQHPPQYSNQIIARNWVIFPNLGRKIQSCPLWMKIGSHGILEVLIPNPDLHFWNSNLKIHFPDPKSQGCSFCLKVGTHGALRKLVLIPTLVFWISHQKLIFGEIWAKKVTVVGFF